MSVVDSSEWEFFFVLLIDGEGGARGGFLDRRVDMFLYIPVFFHSRCPSYGCVYSTLTFHVVCYHAGSPSRCIPKRHIKTPQLDDPKQEEGHVTLNAQDNEHLHG